MAAPGLGRLGAEVVDSTGHHVVLVDKVVLLGQVVALLGHVVLLGMVVGHTVVLLGMVGHVVMGALVVVLNGSSQYILFNLEMSFSLMRKR